jgi:hypothetical protein
LNPYQRIMMLTLWSALCALLIALPASAQTASTTASQPVTAKRDGQLDFDFNLGIWKANVKRLRNPLTGSRDWIDLNGTVNVRRIWDGRAQMDEVELDGPDGHFQIMTLFLYNPESRQWSESFANSKVGTLSVPMIGEFKNGRGEFYSQESLNGRSILARQIWSDIKPNSHRLEQAFSDDGGKTWETNYIATLTRHVDARR